VFECNSSSRTLNSDCPQNSRKKKPLFGQYTQTMRSIITVLVTIPNDFQAAATVQANAEHCAASCFKGLWSFNCFHNDRNIPAISQATLLVRLASRYAHSRVAASWDELAETHMEMSPSYRHSRPTSRPRLCSRCLSLARRSDIPPSDPRKHDVRVRMLRLDIRRGALSTSAGSVATAVKPSHILTGIVPNAHG
jgi:hypothetical protein